MGWTVRQRGIQAALLPGRVRSPGPTKRKQSPRLNLFLWGPVPGQQHIYPAAMRVQDRMPMFAVELNVAPVKP